MTEEPDPSKETEPAPPAGPNADDDPSLRTDPDHEVSDDTRRPTWLEGVESAAQADPDRRSGAEVPDPPAYEEDDDVPPSERRR